MAYRNKLKADYAKRYAEWLRRGEQDEPPERGKLSYMAAQAVRLDLRENEILVKAAREAT